MELKTQEGKYLTFSLAGEEYGLDILKVREIIGILPITKLPEAPPFLKGVVNLRGQLVPVIDLRLRFGLSEAGYSERTCIIVVEHVSEAGKKAIGLVVDSVSEVVNVKTTEIEEPPDLGSQAEMGLIFGIAHVGEELIILLDVGRIVGKAVLEEARPAKETLTEAEKR